MKINFSKYHGAGNDFILIDNRFSNLDLSTEKVAELCNRHFGIGADGLMLLNRRLDYDFEMEYYNSDGNLSTMCGNGGRCITAFASHLGIIEHTATFKAIDGIHKAEVIAQIKNVMHTRLKMVDVDTVKFYNNDFIINTGSPHYVTFVEDADAIDVFNQGKEIRFDKEISGDGVNVNFVEIRKNHLYVRTYERGVEDETLSCGTGVTAAAIAYALNKRIATVKVKTKGGNLIVSFTKTKGSIKNIWLTGPATFVFKGEVEI